MYAQLKSEAIKSSMYWSRLYAKHIDTPRARFYLARKQWYDEMACKYHRLDVQATRENLAQQNIFI